MARTKVLNPFTRKLDYVDDGGPFITVSSTGITTIRWASTPGGVLYDMTLDDTGHVVTTAVAAGGGIIPFWFTLIPQ